MSTRRKITTIIASIVAVFVLGPVAFHFYLRWDCARHRAELMRKGEKLKYQQIVGTAPLPAENGAPALRNVFARLRSVSTKTLFPSVPFAMKELAPGRALIGWQQTNLWRNGEAFDWPDLRSELENYAPFIEEIRQAVAHPAFDFNLNYAQGATLLLPHLGRLKNVSLLLRASALQHLHDHNLEMASRDLNSLVASINVLEKEPIPISQLVRIAQAGIAINSMWEALHADGWTDAQLAEFQKRWATQQFVEPFLAASMMERAMGLQEFDQSRNSFTYYRRMVGSVMDTWNNSENALQAIAEQMQIWTWPMFGSYPTERTCLDLWLVGIDALRLAATNGSYAIVRTDMKSALGALGSPGCDPLGPERSAPSVEGSSVHNAFAGNAASSLPSISRPFTLKAQAQLATTAIALKRYELRHDKLPPDLVALVPEFLSSVPRDPMNGESLHYQPNTNSTFLLYSVGTDGEDNGGDPNPAKSGGSGNSWLSGADWVWPMPATAEETEQYNGRLRENARKRAEQKLRSGSDGDPSPQQPGPRKRRGSG